MQEDVNRCEQDIKSLKETVAQMRSTDAETWEKLEKVLTSLQQQVQFEWIPGLKSLLNL